jgi:hypothetical protein
MRLSATAAGCRKGCKWKRGDARYNAEQQPSETTHTWVVDHIRHDQTVTSCGKPWWSRPLPSGLRQAVVEPAAAVGFDM